MKTKSFFLALAAAFMTIWSCTPSEDGPAAKAALTLSAQQIILAEENNTQEALAITWDDFAAGSEYTVQIANLYAVDWDNAWETTSGSPAVSLTVKQLQDAIVSLGYDPGTDVYIKVRVASGKSYTEEASAVVRLYIPSIVLGVPVITANTQAVTLAEATKLEKALELSWTDSSVESSACHYEIVFADAADTEFAKPIYTEAVDVTSAFFYQLDLNIMLLKADYTLGQTSSLIYRVKAIPANSLVKGSVSETKNLSVTSYTRPVPEPGFVEAIYIAGSGVESQWNIPSEVGKFTEKGNGIYEWTGHINYQGGTFKVLFNGGWQYGFRHGVNDYYWEDAQFVDNIGDDDYGVVLAQGTYKITVDLNKGTLSREIIQNDATTINIMECGTWTEISIPSINESNTVFQGTVDLIAADGFIVVNSDGSRNWVRNTRDAEYSTRWKMSERRAKEDANETMHFHPIEDGTYKVTVDIQNNILTLEK